MSRILNDPDVDEVVCATDAGREGELIFRYIYEAAGCDKPIRRLWIGSLTEDAIRAGLANLREGDQMKCLADAARGRSRADWLVGMNLSRAYTLQYGDTLSVGRVQTPTLAMLVERELAIRNFVPEDYKEVHATFQPVGRGETYEGVYFAPELDGKATRKKGDPEEAAEQQLLARRLPADGEEAARIALRAMSGRAELKSIDARQRRLPPLLLYDLTELQRHANRLFGYSASRTLELAQSLYERRKLISYPRTDSRHLSTDVARELPKIVGAIRGRYAESQVAFNSGRPPTRQALRRRCANHGSPRNHSHRHESEQSVPQRGRRAHLRPDLPQASSGLARRPPLLHHANRHGRCEPRRGLRDDHRPLSEHRNPCRSRGLEGDRPETFEASTAGEGTR